MRAALVAAAFLLLAAPAGAATRDSLSGGCHRVVGLAGAEQVRLQATTLGRYLLLRPDGTFVTPGGASAAPGPAADWRVDDDGSMTTQSGVRVAPVQFSKTSGCAVFPEAGLGATGTPSRGATPFGRVGGLVDGHMHWMTFEYFGGRFHCGRPWHPYGIAAALPDCASIEGPAGSAAPFQKVSESSPVPGSASSSTNW